MCRVPPKVHGIEWPMLTNEANEEKNPMKFLRLDRTIEIIDEPFHSRADFWKSLNLPPNKISQMNNQVEAKTLNSTVADAY